MNLKRDGLVYSGVVGPCEFFISRTVTVPATRIPAKDRWMLEIHGPWYMCRCFPRAKDCRAAVDVVASALEAGAI